MKTQKYFLIWYQFSSWRTLILLYNFIWDLPCKSQGKQSTRKEISALKRSLEITRSCNKWLENQNTDSKQDINCLRQVIWAPIISTSHTFMAILYLINYISYFRYKYVHFYTYICKNIYEKYIQPFFGYLL